MAKKPKLTPEQKEAQEFMEKIVSLCKRKGFVFQASEIYGGMANTYDYGPLGVELLRNVRCSLRHRPGTQTLGLRQNSRCKPS